MWATDPVLPVDVSEVAPIKPVYGTVSDATFPGNAIASRFADVAQIDAGPRKSGHLGCAAVHDPALPASAGPTRVLRVSMDVLVSGSAGRRSWSSRCLRPYPRYNPYECRPTRA